MYLPDHFAAKDRALACELMRAHAFASLVGSDDTGLPFVTHLPLHLEERGERLVLLGHVARANPHAGFLRARPRALACFLGPHAYLSPRVYPDARRVPTWNYLAVHCEVQARLLEGAQAKDALLQALIRDQEPSYAVQWRDLPAEFQQRMLAGIVAFELDVLHWQCKIKLNQHRPEAHAAMRASYASGGPDEQALGRWMDRLGLGGQPGGG